MNDVEKRMLDIANGRFSQVFQGEEAYRFARFIKEKAIPYRSFLVGVPLLEGNVAWFFYHLSDAHQEIYRDSELVINNRLILEIPQVEAYIPTAENKVETDPPEKWKKYPAWIL